MKTLRNLIADGTLSFAKEPADNPGNLDFPYYTVPLIEHDYPAKTPLMWNALYRRFKMPVRNVMLVGDPKNSKEILAVLKNDPRYLGGGAGVGFKDEAINFLDEIDPLAAQIGAVNFILKTADKKLRGYNTDGRGFAAGLETRLKQRGERLQGAKIVILGAGGSANAIAFALAEKQARIVIVNRTIEKAETLAEKINSFYALEQTSAVHVARESELPEELSRADIAVNVSTKGAAGPLEAYSAFAEAKLPATEENIAENTALSFSALSKLKKNSLVCDIVIRNGQTPTLRLAEKFELETMDGLPMVVNQGAEAFWLLHANELREQSIGKDDARILMQRATR